ncbi:type II toxin-antitoxin system HipA family toxin [Halomonas urumqiensis]|uniref:Toxin HipA n=1 Tax=Halomonas urumqiensis TaxID=1684789 RepID=A0A2N7UCH5_9GAMM|nr:HipA domain-containing protein [Halomonas urumqiensis]PMR78105.1 toxin HipA [Halomonas urumqiensis]PTB03256.1 type II toxin-antitoxin system HipA family toxin [Halomonas urumqiensis]GHE20588.1 toxin HipA [Halomonas urumqiensis]
MELTLQLYDRSHWRDAAIVEFPEPEKGTRGSCRLMYYQAYALDWMFRDDEHACSLSLPVELMLNHRAPRWFGFLEDIMPAGASRRFWINQLGLQGVSPGQQDVELLRHGTIAPVGNMRIKEAVPTHSDRLALDQRRFTVNEVVERDTDFLEYAQQMGAASGGATGAGGEAPKLLLRCTPDDQVWIDTWQDDPGCTDAFYLVKFPRGRRSADDCDILRAEYHYYQELHALGVETIATGGMRLIEGERYPSLWLPRFDVEHRVGELVRNGMESIYALMGVPPGTHLNHFAVLESLLKTLANQYRVRELGEWFDAEAFVVEWVRRDLLNVAFGNSDNHGRNTALIKRPEGIWLAPVYDFAPMKADPEGVTRTTRWGAPFEVGGDYDWQAIAEALSTHAAPDRIMQALRQLASELAGLSGRLRQRGVPERILGMPSVGLASLDARLSRWALI